MVMAVTDKSPTPSKSPTLCGAKINPPSSFPRWKIADYLGRFHSVTPVEKHTLPQGAYQGESLEGGRGNKQYPVKGVTSPWNQRTAELSMKMKTVLGQLNIRKYNCSPESQRRTSPRVPLPSVPSCFEPPPFHPLPLRTPPPLEPTPLLHGLETFVYTIGTPVGTPAPPDTVSRISKIQCPLSTRV